MITNKSIANRPIDTKLRRPSGPRAWLFDIDGVITNPETKKIELPQIPFEIARRLNRGDVVGANTGRSLGFAIKAFLDPIEDHLINRRLLSNVTLIAEKGRVQLTELHTSQPVQIVEPQIAGTKWERLKIEVARIIDSCFSEQVFFDHSKLTMITVEMRNGASLDEFQKIQPVIVRRLQESLADLDLQDLLRVDATRIAIDIEDINAGKSLGAKRFDQFLHQIGNLPGEVISFGDSPSDMDMATCLSRLGYSVTFVYVGGPDELFIPNLDQLKIVHPEQLFDIGTLEYLSKT